jgi:hypothetical protein
MNSTVLNIPTSQRVFGKRNEKQRSTDSSGVAVVGGEWSGGVVWLIGFCSCRLSLTDAGGGWFFAGCWTASC